MITRLTTFLQHFGQLSQKNGYLNQVAKVAHWRPFGLRSYGLSSEEKKAVNDYIEYQKRMAMFARESEWQGFKSDVRTLGIMGISLVSFIALGSWISEMGERKESTITAKGQ